MNNKLFLVLIISSLAFVSCTDDNIFKEDISSGAADMSELKVSKDFSWSTARVVEVSITGLPVPSYVTPSKATLVLESENQVYYSGFHAINENQKIVLTIPAINNSINLKFGSIEQTLNIVENKVNFSMIPSPSTAN
jgi:hypothetical protein